MSGDILSRIAREYKSIVDNISYSMDIHSYNVIVVVACDSGAGTSTVAANLATSIKSGNTQRKILLIDANLKNHSLDSTFLPKKTKGLSELVCKRASLNEVINEKVEGNIDVILAGSLPPNTYDLLASENMAEVLNNCKTRYNNIIIDTPACEDGNEDAFALMGEGIGVVIVCKQYKTKIEDLNALAEKIKSTNADVLGVVMKKAGKQKRPLFKLY